MLPEKLSWNAGDIIIEKEIESIIQERGTDRGQSFGEF
jgi:hypothetical protein